MFRWLDESVLSVKSSITESSRALWHSQAGDFRHTWLGRGVELACSLTPFYADPTVVQEVALLERAIEALSIQEEEPAALIARIKTVKKEPLFRLAKGESFETLFPRRVETVECLKNGASEEKLAHFNSYRGTDYSLDEAREVIDLPPLSESEEKLVAFYQRALLIKTVAKRFNLFSREELLDEVMRERDNLLARSGIVPTAGIFLSVGLGLVNPALGVAASAATAGLKMRIRRDKRDALAAASVASSATGLTALATGIILSNPLAVATAAGAALTADVLLHPEGYKLPVEEITVNK